MTIPAASASSGPPLSGSAVASATAPVPAPAPASSPGRGSGPPDLRASGLRAVALCAGRGDPDAVTELVKVTSPQVWRVCALLVDRGVADDLTQETYLRAVRSLPSYRGDAEPVRWLLTIARRVCAEEIARRQRVRHAAARVRGERPATAIEPALGVEMVDAIARLSEPRREAFLLTAVAGFSYAEAAALCQCPIGTVRSRVARARVELLDTLDLITGGAGEPGTAEAIHPAAGVAGLARAQHAVGRRP